MINLIDKAVHQKPFMSVVHAVGSISGMFLGYEQLSAESIFKMKGLLC